MSVKLFDYLLNLFN